MAINVESKQSVIVDGTGETKQQAFASALANIQKQLIADTHQTILRIIPETVTPLVLHEETYTEKFLFFFFKRQRTTFHVKLDVKVTITSIDLDALAFDQRTLQSPDALPLPRFKRTSKGVK
jgi:uncharacterized protein (TIGR03578 family)